MSSPIAWHGGQTTTTAAVDELFNDGRVSIERGVDSWVLELEGGRKEFFNFANQISRFGDFFADVFEEENLDPTAARLKEINELLEAGNVPIATAAHLMTERNQLEAEYAAQQQAIADLQASQQQLEFLQQQLDLIDTLTAAGLDASAVLGGIQLGAEASSEDLLAAITAAIQALTQQAAGAFATGGYTGDGPSDQIAGPVHRREFVLNEQAVNRWGRPLLEQMNSGTVAGVTGMATATTATPVVGETTISIMVDARGNGNITAVEEAGYRGAKKAMREAGYRADVIRRVR